jgi:hypothetical protein
MKAAAVASKELQLKYEKLDELKERMYTFRLQRLFFGKL